MNQELVIKTENNELIISDLSKSLIVSKNKELAKSNCLNTIWKFESLDDIYLLINSFTDELSKIIICKKGVLEGFEWSINEALDNVLQHSGENFGYVQGQVNKRKKHFKFCVLDTGQGIYKSLLQSKYKPQNAMEALQLAVKEGITRDKKIGQGNGLWGLHQIVSENTGKLTIISNSAIYSLSNNKSETSELKTPFENGCIVYFELDYSREISISKALGGYEPVNLKMESLEDPMGNIVIDMRTKESGVGTRQSGVKIRNELMNIYTQTNKVITLNFEGIKIISSSFADELIGKLVKEYGFFNFTNIFNLKNMNANVQTIVQRSVAQRMMDSFETV